MKLLNAVIIASCALQVTARLHSRDLLGVDQNDLCEHEACIVSNANPDNLLFRRKGGTGRVQAPPPEKGGTPGDKDIDTNSVNDGSESGSTGNHGSGASSEGSPLRITHDDASWSQEERLKAALNRIHLPKKNDPSPRKFDDADEETIQWLEARRNEPDDDFEARPDYGEATIRAKGEKVLLPSQPRSRDVQDRVDAKVSKNYEVQSQRIDQQTDIDKNKDLKYAQLFTARGIAPERIQRVTVHSKGAPDRDLESATAIYYVDDDMHLVVCAEAFAARDTNAFVKGASEGHVVKSPNANENAVSHSDMMWAILAKVGGAQTSTRVGNVREVIQHDVINLGTVLTLFRISKANDRAVSDVRPFTFAEYPEWAGTANVSPTVYLKKDHSEVAGNLEPTQVRTAFLYDGKEETYDLLLSIKFE